MKAISMSAWVNGSKPVNAFLRGHEFFHLGVNGKDGLLSSDSMWVERTCLFAKGSSLEGYVTWIAHGEIRVCVPNSRLSYEGRSMLCFPLSGNCLQGRP